MDHWANNTISSFITYRNSTINDFTNSKMSMIFESATSQALIDTFNSFEANSTNSEDNNTFKPKYNLAKVLQLRRQMEDQRIVTTIAGLFGILTTSLMLFLILRNVRLRTLSNMYYFMMFLSLFGMMFLRVSCQIPLMVNDNYIFSDEVCNICLRIRRFFYASALAFLSVVTLNRMFVICFPSKAFLTGTYISMINLFSKWYYLTGN